MNRSAFLAGSSALAAAAALAAPLRAFASGAPVNIRLPLLDGGTFSTAAYRGRPLWVNFFASWCEGCNVEQPTITALAKEYRSSGLRVVGISAGETALPVRGYRKYFRVPYPIAMDVQQTVTRRYAVDAKTGNVVLPANLFLDAQGRFVRGFDGPVEKGVFEALLPDLLAR